MSSISQPVRTPARLGPVRLAAALTVIALGGLLAVRRHLEGRDAAGSAGAAAHPASGGGGGGQLRATTSQAASLADELASTVAELKQRAHALVSGGSAGSSAAAAAAGEEQDPVEEAGEGEGGEAGGSGGGEGAAGGEEPPPPSPPRVVLPRLYDLSPTPTPTPYVAPPGRTEFYDAKLDYDFHGTAVVTLAAGNNAIRGAIALFQSLRDSGTRVQTLLVMLSRGGEGSPECRNATWKEAVGRPDVECHSEVTVPEEIASPFYLDVLTQKLGATLQVVDPIPSTPYTDSIPGGRSTFWGMALNKMRVFNMTHYKKLLWMDSDTIVFKNMDHLFKEPAFTTAVAVDCCNANGPNVPAGGLWVVEPSPDMGAQLWRMMVDGQPAYDERGKNVYRADGTPERAVWNFGDQEILRWLVSRWDPDEGTVWPRITDVRYGVVDGLRYLPEFAGLSDAEFAEKALYDRATGKPTVVGWKDASRPQPAGLAVRERGMFGLDAPAWRPLSVLYDPFVGNCECLPQRDAPEHVYSVHFSCLQILGKPSSYESEHDFMTAIGDLALSCTRHYYLAYHAFYVRAAGRLPPPYWTGPPVPGHDAKFDEGVVVKQAAHRAHWAAIEAKWAEAEEARQAAEAAANKAAAEGGGGGGGGGRRLAATREVVTPQPQSVPLEQLARRGRSAADGGASCRARR